MKKIRYAVVGAGKISQDAFLPSIGATSNSEVTAIVSGGPEAARKLAAQFDIPHVFSYEEYDRMLAQDIVDAVYIALPNSLHADYAIAAAKAGKHALVEKPLAISIAECDAMIAAAKENDVLLMTAYRLHSEPGTVKILELIREGEIGDPRHFISTRTNQLSTDNHRLQAQHWGGPLQDIGIYCVNAARHCFGAEPVEAIAMAEHGDNDPRFTEVVGAVAATLRFPKGRLAQFLVSFEGDYTDTIRIIGTRGEITVEQACGRKTNPRIWLSKAGTRHEIEVPDSDHFAGQTAYFSDCILSQTRPVCDGEEGLADVRALLAIETAARTGQPQKISTPARGQHPDASTVRILPRLDPRPLKDT